MGPMGNLAVEHDEDRRVGPRVMTRLFVRGLGDDRSWTDRLGDVAVGGVGFEFPKAPDADRFQVAFHCPGEEKLRHAVADVVDIEPLPGTQDREQPFFVRLQFSKIAYRDERALARSLDRLAHA